MTRNGDAPRDLLEPIVDALTAAFPADIRIEIARYPSVRRRGTKRSLERERMRQDAVIRKFEPVGGSDLPTHGLSWTSMRAM